MFGDIADHSYTVFTCNYTIPDRFLWFDRTKLVWNTFKSCFCSYFIVFFSFYAFQVIYTVKIEYSFWRQIWILPEISPMNSNISGNESKSKNPRWWGHILNKSLHDAKKPLGSSVSHASTIRSLKIKYSKKKLPQPEVLRGLKRWAEKHLPIRLVAPMTITSPRESNPSMSANKVETIEEWMWSCLLDRTGAKPRLENRSFFKLRSVLNLSCTGEGGYKVLFGVLGVIAIIFEYKSIPPFLGELELGVIKVNSAKMNFCRNRKISPKTEILQLKYLKIPNFRTCCYKSHFRSDFEYLVL